MIPHLIFNYSRFLTIAFLFSYLYYFYSFYIFTSFNYFASSTASLPGNEIVTPIRLASITSANAKGLTIRQIKVTS